MRISSAYFEITNLCNLNCVTCYNRSGLNHTRRELSFAQLRQIMERLVSEFGCTSFSFAGGEPFLHTEFDSLLSYVKEHPDYQFSFVTNGTTIRDSFFEALRENPSHFKVQVSLDGSCESINALTRGTGSFEKTMQFLDRLSAESIRPLLKMVISQNNLDDIEPFFHMAMNHGCTPTFSFMAQMGNAVDSWDSISLSARQKIQILKLLDRLNQAYPEYATDLPYTGTTCSLTIPDNPTSALIKTDGTLFPCQLLYDEAYSCGNILEDPTEEIVAKIQRLQKLAITRLSQDYNCNRCPLHLSCARGCFANAIYHCGDPLGDDGDCLTRKLEFFDFHLKKQMQK